MLLCELLRPVAFAVAFLAARTEPREGTGLFSLVGFLYWITHCPLLSGSDRVELEAASAAHQT